MGVRKSPPLKLDDFNSRQSINKQLFVPHHIKVCSELKLKSSGILIRPTFVGLFWNMIFGYFPPLWVASHRQEDVRVSDLITD